METQTECSDCKVNGHEEITDNGLYKDYLIKDLAHLPAGRIYDDRAFLFLSHLYKYGKERLYCILVFLDSGDKCYFFVPESLVPEFMKRMKKIEGSSPQKKKVEY